MTRRIIVLLMILGLSALFWSKKNNPRPLDDAIQRTIDYQDRVQSYTAHIEDYDAQGKQRADIDYVIDGQNWVIRHETTYDTVFEWRKIGGDLYILNADTGWFWKIADSNTSLPTRVDPRDAINEVQHLLKKKTFHVLRIGSEPCGEHLCWRYQLVDPSFAIVERYWWVDASEFRLVKDQFVIGNGETSITTYDYEKEIKIETPTLIRDAPADADIMALPGSIKNLSTPKVQKSV